MNINIDFDINPTPDKLSILLNECTGSIMQRTYLVQNNDAAGFGKSLWESAEFLDNIFKATERLGYTISKTDELLQEASGNPTDYLENPDSQKLSQMRDMATELLRVKKNDFLNLASKSAEALKIAKNIGLNDVTQFRDRVLELNIILNQRIRT